jgi:hypothetical protein
LLSPPMPGRSHLMAARLQFWLNLPSDRRAHAATPNPGKLPPPNCNFPRSSPIGIGASGATKRRRPTLQRRPPCHDARRVRAP